MKNIIFFFIFCNLLIISLMFRIVEAREWYEGGTLHKATVKEYLQGKPDNVLATTADWVCASIDSSLLRKMRDNGELNMNRIKRATTDVITCVVESSDGMDEIYNQKAVEIAFLCMSLLKANYPWMLTK